MFWSTPLEICFRALDICFHYKGYTKYEQFLSLRLRRPLINEAIGAFKNAVNKFATDQIPIEKHMGMVVQKWVTMQRLVVKWYLMAIQPYYKQKIVAVIMDATLCDSVT